METPVSKYSAVLATRTNACPASPARMRRGYTLTELLVTITIIVVLAALAFVMLGRARQAALNAKCVGSLRRLAVAGNQYVADRGAYPPNGAQANGNMGHWFKSMETYLGFEEGTKPSVIERDERCPTCGAALKAAPPGNQPYIRTLSMNQGLLGATNSSNGTIFPGLRASKVKDMSRTAFFTDGVRAEGRYWERVTRRPQWNNPQDFVHNGKANVVFIDGHVESMTVSQVPPNGIPFWNPTAE